MNRTDPTVDFRKIGTTGYYRAWVGIKCDIRYNFPTFWWNVKRFSIYKSSATRNITMTHIMTNMLLTQYVIVTCTYHWRLRTHWLKSNRRDYSSTTVKKLLRIHFPSLESSHHLDTSKGMGFRHTDMKLIFKPMLHNSISGKYCHVQFSPPMNIPISRINGKVKTKLK